MTVSKASPARARCHAARFMLGLLAGSGALPALGVARDIEFECPCTAVWIADDDDTGKEGELELTFGLRSHRTTDSGEIWLRAWSVDTDAVRFASADGTVGPIGSVASRMVVEESRKMALTLNEPGDPVSVTFEEKVGDLPTGPEFHHHRDRLMLWPVSDGDDDKRIEYVDILVDADGDGVGDVNERIAGTAADDPASTPGPSTVDVLAVYTEGFRDEYAGDPYTRIHHVMTVTRALFVDSGSNVEIRTVGMSEVDLGDGELDELSEQHGADVTVEFHAGEVGCDSCAALGGWFGNRGWWGKADWAVVHAWRGPVVAAHELGHVFGLGHSSFEDKRSDGTFRWSRGHRFNVAPNGFRGWATRLGSIMSYGDNDCCVTAFADPDAHCGTGPCGVPVDQPDGADAVAGLDIMRFQVAAHRAAKPDTDGDGIVDPADALPEDSGEWRDADGDGIGDNADEDDDNDDVKDTEDAFPYDPAEWADVDGDGIGDNADDDVVDLGPIRDPALRAAVGDALGITVSEPVTADDLATLTTLHAHGRGITDLTGLEWATNLETLLLWQNEIADVAPLASLKSVSELNLRGNRISDLSPLSGMTELQKLLLNGNPIIDVAPLAGLQWLETLNLSATWVDDLTPLADLKRLIVLEIGSLGTTYVGGMVSDLSPVAGLSRLSKLGLHGHRVTDLSPLAELTELHDLDLSFNPIADLTPLAGLEGLQYLKLRYTSINDADLSALAGLKRLRTLALDGVTLTDLSPLAGMVELERLHLGDAVGVADLTPLAGLKSMWELYIGGNRVSDLSPLSGLTELRALYLSANPVSDISALVRMEKLERLYLDDTLVEDVTPLAGLLKLRYLDLSRSLAAWDDVAALLPSFDELYLLTLDGLGIDDLSPLRGMTHMPTWMYLEHNHIADLSPLGDVCCLSTLSLEHNNVSDISPLLRREIWGGENSEGQLVLYNNPLTRGHIEEDTEADFDVLRSWGIGVLYREYEDQIVPVPDRALRDLLIPNVDMIIHYNLARLRTLRAFNAGISDLSGLDAAISLEELFAGGNSISDLAPLTYLESLNDIDLSDNLILDLAPLAANAGIGGGDQISLTGNPLTEESLNTHVPALRDAGAQVAVDSVAWVVPASGGATTFDTSGYFASLLESGIGLEAEEDDPDGLASVAVAGMVLEVVPGNSEGRLEITVTATDDSGETATLVFAVEIARPEPVALFPSAADPVRQGFVRVINRSAEAGTVRIDATDDDGQRAGPVWIPLRDGAAVHFNSEDLENGNRAKLLAGMSGPGRGDWRLGVASPLDIEVLAYVRTTDGFLTAMHDVAPQRDGTHRVAIFNPGSNTDQASLLRLVNPGDEDAAVTIRGVDDCGDSPGGPVEVSVPAGASRTHSAADLEAGTGVSGALGPGTGKWALTVSSDQPIRVMNLLETPGGHLTNLSTIPAADDGIHAVPLFPPASDPLGRQGFVRVINRSDEESEVHIAPFDDTARDYGALTLTVDAGTAIHFNSNDLESGNADKRLSGSTGAGEGDWRLELTSDADIEVLSYIRTNDGFLTSMHDTVPETGGKYHVLTFNPGRNANQVSRLRLVNTGSRPAEITISGNDDAGGSSSEVRTSVPPRAARSYTSSELETGGGDLQGALRKGTGKWRLTVDSDQPITVLNLLESPTGHLTNLSSVP